MFTKIRKGLQVETTSDHKIKLKFTMTKPHLFTAKERVWVERNLFGLSTWCSALYSWNLQGEFALKLTID